MSLKAKLEAVIYASEEPVTLAQLASLFAEEAFAWRAEQQAAETAPAPGPGPLLDEGLAYLGLEDTPGIAEASAAAVPELAGLEAPAAETAAAEADGKREAEAEGLAEAGAEAAGAPAAPAPLDMETEAKRLARQRDREVRAILRQVLDELIATYASDDRGLEIREIAGGYRMATKPSCHDAVRLFIRSLKPPLKLSLPALETLAVIAYKQPVTAPEVNEIRGVDSSGVFGSLISRKLITTAGRKQVIGRPILYKTTKEFLLRFGLKDVAELPSMEEFEKIAAMELSEPGDGAEEAAGERTAESGGDEQAAEPAEAPENAADGEQAAEPAEAAGAPAAESASEEEAALTETATVPLAGAESNALEPAGEEPAPEAPTHD